MTAEPWNEFELVTVRGRSARKVHLASDGSSRAMCGWWMRTNAANFAFYFPVKRSELCENCLARTEEAENGARNRYELPGNVEATRLEAMEFELRLARKYLGWIEERGGRTVRMERRIANIESNLERERAKAPA